jgi:cardiolipin synthase (CMP-forming)
MKTQSSFITVATYFTLVRIACIPFIFLSMINHAWVALTALFVLASITDVIDGFIARTFNQISWLGTLLDPLADKFLLITLYAGLTFSTFVPIALPVWFLSVVLIHELLLIGGAYYWSVVKHSDQISPSWLAKLLGVGQFLFIIWVLLSGFVGSISELLFYQMLMLLTLGRLCVLLEYGMRIHRTLGSL